MYQQQQAVGGVDHLRQHYLREKSGDRSATPPYGVSYC